uniref:Truncated Agno protein n=1 Tax=JC polyomavirus TaxID=10632 RepID=I0B5Z1_POVJC|nr:truncated Agno protein [JC polyomavirus]
MVLRQLSRFD